MKRVEEEEEEEEEWKANETKLDGLWTDEKRIYRGKGRGKEKEKKKVVGREGRVEGERKRGGAAKLAV